MRVIETPHSIPYIEVDTETSSPYGPVAEPTDWRWNGRVVVSVVTCPNCDDDVVNASHCYCGTAA